MNSVRLVQQLKSTPLEYKESDRLDAKVTRAFHKNLKLETYTTSTLHTSTSPGPSGVPSDVVPGVPGVPSDGVPGVPSDGVPSDGVPSPGVPSPGVPSPGVPSPGVPSPGVPSPGVPSFIKLNTPLTSVSTATSIAQNYPLVVDSKKISVDDKMIMVYWRKALEIPFGKIQAEQMRTAVEEAIADLAIVFPPPRPKVSDVCHQHFEEALEKYGSGNCGVYHFARWVAIGQRGVKDPVLSSRFNIKWSTS
ncbi:hypothetical protein BGX38DRAFT_1333315 [Terfezia claveryi]|nr:hypothetical protein BGX38DRAFT_1333315 [Terfezia claveryi]